jgi:saccharopine dehydrogenase-like NADP-dependent oxidoreductase
MNDYPTSVRATASFAAAVDIMFERLIRIQGHLPETEVLKDLAYFLSEATKQSTMQYQVVEEVLQKMQRDALYRPASTSAFIEYALGVVDQLSKQPVMVSRESLHHMSLFSGAFFDFCRAFPH